MLTLKSWGTNSHGQLGLGFDSEQEGSPRKLPISEEITDIACGGSHTLLLTSNGLFSSGLNDMFQLGRRTERKFCPEFLKVDLVEDVVAVMAGWDFSVARTRQGDIYCWGGNKFKQLGNGEEVISSPKRLGLLSPSLSVACGMRFSVILLDEGRRAEVLGKLGRGANLEPTQYSLHPPEGRKFVEVSCGQHHFILLDDGGDIWTYGCNKHGQRGVQGDHQKLSKLKLDIQDTVVDVKCGWTFGALLTSGGHVYTWGRNTYGQLGRHTESSVDGDVKQVDIKGVKKIAVGSEHCLALTGDGCLYAWGWNEHGNCGDGTTVDLKIPVVLFPNRRKDVRNVWSGHGHNVLQISGSPSYQVEVLHIGYAIDNGEFFKANCTCTLITGPRNVIIDTMTPWDKNLILEALRSRCIRPKEIDVLVSTHGHSDHIGNNNLFLNAMHIVGYCVSRGDSYWMHPFDAGEPYIIDGDRLQILPMPGHTADDVTVLVKADDLGTIAVAGDIFERMEDIFDPSIWRSAGSADPERQERSRDKIISIADYVIPGHGQMFKVTDEMRKELKKQASRNT